MDHWITTHYPHPVPDHVPWNIYFRQKPVTIPAVGDRVLFYESYVPQADRNVCGRKGIVCAAVVAGGMLSMSGIGAWVHQIPCTGHRSGVVVPLKIARDIIAGPFYRRTLWRLTEEQFNAIADKMAVSG